MGYRLQNWKSCSPKTGPFHALAGNSRSRNAVHTVQRHISGGEIFLYKTRVVNQGKNPCLTRKNPHGHLHWGRPVTRSRCLRNILRVVSALRFLSTSTYLDASLKSKKRPTTAAAPSPGVCHTRRYLCHRALFNLNWRQEREHPCSKRLSYGTFSP